MKKLLVAGLLMALLSGPMMAGDNVVVLIIDSGVDYNHQQLQPYMIADPAELNGQPGIDNNNSGYADDVYGWNFVDNSPVQVDLNQTPPDYDDVLRFLELLGKFQVGGQQALTSSEFEFLRDKVSDEPFIRWTNFVGTWAHGTHVGGTAALNSNSVGLKGITHVPSGQGPQYEYESAMEQVRSMIRFDRFRRSDARDPMDMLIDYFDSIAFALIEDIKPQARYIARLNPRVINCSFGSENAHLFNMMKNLLVQDLGVSNPSDEQVQALVNLFVTRAFLPRDLKFFSHVPDALIVIASGNAGDNLDNIVASPNNVPIENKLVVGATYKDLILAPFSCHGATAVDVAVPGVNILSTFPNNRMGYMTGTSMAAPLASQYAAEVFAANPSLTAVEVRRILMDTVDRKSWLEGKVKSGGVLNPVKAVQAARFTARGMSLNEAIEQANEEAEKELPVRGVSGPDPRSLIQIPVFETEEELAIYNSAIF